MTSSEIFSTLKGILYTASFYRDFITTGWIGRLFPVKKASPLFKGEAFKSTVI